MIYVYIFIAFLSLLHYFDIGFSFCSGKELKLDNNLLGFSYQGLASVKQSDKRRFIGTSALPILGGITWPKT